MSSGAHDTQTVALDTRVSCMRIQQLLEEVQRTSERIGGGNESDELLVYRQQLVGEIIRRHYAASDAIEGARARAETYRIHLDRCKELLNRADDEIAHMRAVVAECPTQKIEPVEWGNSCSPSDTPVHLH